MKEIKKDSSNKINQTKHIKKEWKSADTAKSFLMTSNTLFFTDEDHDLISNNPENTIKLEKEKEIPKKKAPRKKNKELDKPKEIEEYELDDKQKQLVQKNSIIRERLLTIEKIIELFPNLKKEKKLIVDNVLGKTDVQKRDYVVEKLDLKNKNMKNKIFYKDSFGNIMNGSVELVGFWTEKYVNGAGEKPKIDFVFFDDIKRIKAKLNKNKKALDLKYIGMMMNKSIEEVGSSESDKNNNSA